MLISLSPPPLAILDGFRGAGELCQRESIAGTGELCQRASLGQLDPISTIVSSVVGSGASIFKTIQDSKLAKKQLSLEAQQIKEQKAEAAQQFALQQAQAITGPVESHIMDQKIALYAVGGVALLVAGLFLVSTVKLAKKETK